MGPSSRLRQRPYSNTFARCSMARRAKASSRIGNCRSSREAWIQGMEWRGYAKDVNGLPTDGGLGGAPPRWGHSTGQSKARTSSWATRLHRRRTKTWCPVASARMEKNKPLESSPSRQLQSIRAAPLHPHNVEAHSSQETTRGSLPAVAARQKCRLSTDRPTSMSPPSKYATGARKVTHVSTQRKQTLMLPQRRSCAFLSSRAGSVTRTVNLRCSSSPRDRVPGSRRCGARSSGRCAHARWRASAPPVPRHWPPRAGRS